MFFLAEQITGFDCGGTEILKLIKFIYQLKDVVLYMVPIGLIVMLTIDFFKNVAAGKEEDMKKNLNIAIKRLIFCLGLFLVPSFVNTALMLLDKQGLEFAQCVTIATESTVKELEQYKITYDDNLEDVEEPYFGKDSSQTPSSNSSGNSNGTSSGSQNTQVKFNIFIGDSRTVGMKNALGDTVKNTGWICEVGKGYSWFVSDAIPSLNSVINKNRKYNIIINLGVNDLDNIDKYIGYYNKMSSDSKYRNTKIIIVSVNPIDETKFSGNNVTNQKIKDFNKQLKNGLRAKIKYCNTYSKIQNDLKTADDGLHYSNETSKKIYNLIVDNCL